MNWKYYKSSVTVNLIFRTRKMASSEDIFFNVWQFYENNSWKSMGFAPENPIKITKDEAFLEMV